MFYHPWAIDTLQIFFLNHLKNPIFKLHGEFGYHLHEDHEKRCMNQNLLSSLFLFRLGGKQGSYGYGRRTHSR